MRMYRRNFDELGMQWNTILGIRKNVAQKRMDKSLVQLAVKPFFLADSGYFPENGISEMRFRVIVPALLRRGMGGPWRG